ncbi:MAG: hypothetical protein KC591_03015, partial [Gemmatimonadetes bacterium]|nr:hypothetical protein [Gemmatimonadota bacterium]
MRLLPVAFGAAAALMLVSMPAPTLAAWSSDPLVNLSVADGASDQTQPKLAPTADGGAWVSWFDGIANGFDVRVQRLDGAGNEVLAHNGVLVADRGFTSTQDYGLDLDASGNALLIFRDDRPGGTQITAAAISDAGVALWGASGVVLTNTTAFVAAPKIAGTSDGGAVVAWTQDADVHVQKLDASGATVWASDVVLTPAVGTYSVSDLHDAGTDVILSMVHQTGSFLAPRHLVAQKFDATGAALWGATPVQVFDGGSLQLGNFPYFVPDGSGGGVFAWYSNSPLQCRVQHVSSAGAEVFAHNGVEVSTNASRIRVSPSAGYDPVGDNVFVFWKEQDSLQSQSGVYGQKIDGTGARQWGTDGIVVVGVSAVQTDQVRCLVLGSGATAFWVASPAFGQDTVRAAHVDGAGTVDVGPVGISTITSGKSRLAAANSALGFSITAWVDDRIDDGDVYVQNLNSDGSLGGGASGLPAIAGAAGLELMVSPNPARDVVRIEFAMPEGARDATLEIVDVAGRRVRTDLARLGDAATTAVW